MRFKSEFADITKDERLHLSQFATNELMQMNVIEKESILKQTKLFRRYHSECTIMDLTKPKQNRIFEILAMDEELEKLRENKI